MSIRLLISGSRLGTPSSSPARIKRAAAKRMSNLWLSLKNSSPVRKARGSLWSVPRDKFRKQFEDAGRLSYSHPDISHSNLARLGHDHSGNRSKDDMFLVCNSPEPNASITAGTSKCSNTTIIKSQIHSNEARRKLLDGVAADSFVSYSSCLSSSNRSSNFRQTMTCCPSFVEYREY